MKKVLVIMLIGCGLMITGCGKEETPIPGFDEQPQEQKENNNSEQGNQNDDITDVMDIELYSDDEKIVFDTTAYKLVFYYSGNDITGYEMYYDFGSKEMATFGRASIENNLDNEVSSVKQNSKYIIVKFNESVYEDLTVESVRAAYSTLQEVKKSN